MTPALTYLVSGLHWPTDGMAGRPGYEPIEETMLSNGVRLGLAPVYVWTDRDPEVLVSLTAEAEHDVAEASVVRAAETLAATTAVVYDCPTNPLEVVRVDVRCVQSDGSVSGLANRAWRVPSGLVLDEALVWHLLGSGWMYPREVMETAAHVLPAAINSPLHEAVHYFSESIRGVWVSPGDYLEVLMDGTAPLSTTDRVQVEQALQNAFKCVEALTGEPPTLERKRRALLAALNVDPDEEVGFEIAEGPSYRTTALKKLSEFQSARDRQAAHAGIPNQRAARYAELLDFQQFARFVCLRALGAEQHLD